MLVTGGGGHLGARIVARLSRRASALAINDLDPAAATALVDGLDGVDAAAFPGDVGDAATARAVVEAAEARFGAIDVLVNAAGIEGPVAAIDELDPSDVERVFTVNALSQFWTCAAVVPAMREHGGRIVNIASGAGLVGGAYGSAYHASKHAVVGLTRSLARELGPDGIAVNAVCPGYVASPMVERILEAETAIKGRRPNLERAIPLGRMGDPDEVADVVAFLAFDAPLYMTGECLGLDGALRA